MEIQQTQTTKLINYANSPRALKALDFPTIGFYFIHSISERMDLKGNRFPVAIIDWKLNISETWLDPEEVKYLRLDYLYSRISERPQIEMWTLTNQIIEVEYSSISYSDDTPKGMPFFKWKLAAASLPNIKENLPNPELAISKSERLAKLCEQLLSSNSTLDFDYDDIAYSQDFDCQDASLIEQQVLQADDLVYSEYTMIDHACTIEDQSNGIDDGNRYEEQY